MPNNQDIIQEAINKASLNGWKPTVTEGVDYSHLIYNHDFANALWPGEIGTDDGRWVPAWRYHLKEMVIAPDPIQYLKENM